MKILALDPLCARALFLLLLLLCNLSSALIFNPFLSPGFVLPSCTFTFNFSRELVSSDPAILEIVIIEADNYASGRGTIIARQTR